ncbi:MAG: T9SS type A sorting domain-containing protein [Ignavibacteriae bacterium]|nr:T9SS type A sorting domain-containing protein [Ignavibacteriota bacterium]
MGADTRCASWNTSSKSAFLRVARPGDTTGVLTLNIQVLSTPFGREPIDSLQALFNNWITSVNTISSEIPENFYLTQNYPNPFNPTTNLEFGISELGFVSLKVYNSSGKEVAILVNESKPAGKYSVTFSATSGGSNLSSGIYYYRLSVSDGSGNHTETKRMVLLK